LKNRRHRNVIARDLHPITRNIGAHCHPKMRKHGACLGAPALGTPVIAVI